MANRIKIAFALALFLICGATMCAGEPAAKKPTMKDVVREMEKSKEFLDADASTASSLKAQERAIAMLDAMIEQQQKQQQQQNQQNQQSQQNQNGKQGQQPQAGEKGGSKQQEGQKQSSSGSSQSAGEQGGSQQNGNGRQGGQGDKPGAGGGEPAKDSKLAGAPSSSGDAKGQPGPRGDGAWGDLPERERKEALNKIVEQYGELHRDLIEQYYRKLNRTTKDDEK